MNIENQISELNEFYFFKEFTYSDNKFVNSDGQEVEVADNIIFLDDIFIVYQIKTREQIKKTSVQSELMWFEKKVIRKATKQIRDTISYLEDYDEIVLKNNRDDSFNIATADINSIQKIIVYKDSGFLPEHKKKIKFHESRSAGIIHIFSEESYKKIISILITPAEVFEYFIFREKVITKYPHESALVSEDSLIGHYIIGDIEKPPAQKHFDLIQKLEKNYASWNILSIIHLFPERVTRSVSQTDYYYILREVGKLMRNELKLFKERFMLSIESSKKNEPDLPYRFAIPRSDLGFVFIPLCQNQISNRKMGLTNLTLGHKYDQKLRKCIGASFIYESDGWFSIEWCFMEFEWEYDAELEKMLETNFPFRKVNSKYINRYNML